MREYLDSLAADLMMPYPAIYNALGMNSRDLQVTSGIQADGVGYVRFQATDETNIIVLVFPDMTHGVGGKIRGRPFPSQRFNYQTSAPGIHRGVQGNITSYLSDQVGGTLVYKVVSSLSGATIYESLDALLQTHKSIGVTEETRPVRKELHGQPILAGMVGPMWDGRQGDVGVIRYETEDVYARLSR